MCGRFTLYENKDFLSKYFNIDIEGKLFKPSYNIAPTQNSLVIYTIEDKRICTTMRWGLVPFWSKDIKIGYKMINARAETVDEKPSFKRPFKDKRCLVLTNGFYEWKKVDSKNKIPYFVRLRNNKPFTFAGLWDNWKKDDNDLNTFTIITTEANKLMQTIHDRMPVIISKKDRNKWLDPEMKDTDKLKDMLKPYPPEEMQAHEISTFVNSPKNNSPMCIQPVS